MAVLTRAKSTVYGLETSLTTLQTNINNEATTRGNKDTSLQNELDVTQTGAGLSVDGAYVANGSTNYLGAASSLMSADVLLDSAVKAEKDRAEGVEGVLTSLTTTAKSNLVAAINEVDADLTSAVSTLNTTISTKATESIARDDALDARLDVVEGEGVGSIAKALADAKAYTDDEIVAANGDIGDVQARLDVIEGDSTVEGSIAKAIADVIGSAPEALNTLKEIADYINVSPDTDILTAITNAVTGAKEEIKGEVSVAYDTLAEVETSLNVIQGSGVGSISKAVVDAKAYSDALKTAADLAASTEHAARVAEEGRIEDKLDDEIADRKTEITRVEGLITDAETAASNASALKLAIASNLSDLANVATARTNISVYSKSETDDAIRSGGAVFITEALIVSSDKIVLGHAPKNGVVFNFATVRHTDANFVSYDIPVTVTADVSGKEFQLHPNTTGEFDSKVVLVQYAYSQEV
jgi:hypothetical protein